MWIRINFCCKKTSTKKLFASECMIRNIACAGAQSKAHDIRQNVMLCI